MFVSLSRNKNNPPPYPVLSSISVLFCYHLGTAVKGSFLITVLRIPRIVLLYLCNILNQKVGKYFCNTIKIEGWRWDHGAKKWRIYFLLKNIWYCYYCLLLIDGFLYFIMFSSLGKLFSSNSDINAFFLFSSLIILKAENTNMKLTFSVFIQRFF